MEWEKDKGDITSLPLFFIIGRPRSGTTLLRFLFEAHPQVLIPPESPFIIALYKKYAHITQWNRKSIEAFCEDLVQQRYFDKWLISEKVLLDHLLKCEGECTFRDMVKQVILAYRSPFEKKDITLIGDKNPAYSLYVKRIHRLFPESRIIHITRDYRDNYLSLIRVNFEVPVVPLVVYRWKFALHQMWKLRERHPGIVYSLRYEDLVSDPERVFKGICDFLELPYDPAVFEFYRKKEEVEKAYLGSEEIMQVHRSLFNPVSKDRLNGWKKEMTPRQVRMADLVAGRSADKAGYARQYTSRNPLLYLTMLPILTYAGLMYRLILFGDHLPYRMRNGLNRILGVFLKVYWKINKREVKPL